MAVSIQKLEKHELPAVYHTRKAEFAYKVTAHDGEVFYLDSEEDAAALVAAFHMKDRRENPELLQNGGPSTQAGQRTGQKSRG